MEALDVRGLAASLSGMALLGYVLAVIGATLLIRVIMCYLRCIEKNAQPTRAEAHALERDPGFCAQGRFLGDQRTLRFPVPFFGWGPSNWRSIRC